MRKKTAHSKAYTFGDKIYYLKTIYEVEIYCNLDFLLVFMINFLFK